MNMAIAMGTHMEVNGENLACGLATAGRDELIIGEHVYCQACGLATVGRDELIIQEHVYCQACQEMIINKEEQWNSNSKNSSDKQVAGLSAQRATQPTSIKGHSN